jgi:glycosyltransferase involved in cell wall biosynthesis
MAFGTVPIITPEVSIKSYMDPPIENVHYITVNNPEELKEKIGFIDEKKWSKMSKACSEWYAKNIHSANCWNNMIENILYEK